MAEELWHSNNDGLRARVATNDSSAIKKKWNVASLSTTIVVSIFVFPVLLLPVYCLDH